MVGVWNTSGQSLAFLLGPLLIVYAEQMVEGKNEYPHSESDYARLTTFNSCNKD